MSFQPFNQCYAEIKEVTIKKWYVKEGDVVQEVNFL